MESRLTVRLDEEMRNELDKRAKKLKLTSAELVRIFVSDGLSEHDKNHAQLVLLLSEVLNKLADNTKLSSGAFAASAFIMAMNEPNPGNRREILKGHIPRMFELGENLKKYMP